MEKQVLLFFLFISTLSFAQVRVGVLVGGDLATQKNSAPPVTATSFTTSPIFAYHGGLMVSLPMMSRLSFQSALLYRVKGSKTKSSALDVVTTTHYKYEYIEAPLHLAYALDLNKKLKFTPYAGVYAAYAISVKSSETTVDKTVSQTTTKDFNFNDVNHFDFGGQLGIGLEVKDLFFRAQCSLGLVNVFLEDSKTYNQGLSLSVGYWINK